MDREPGILRPRPRKPFELGSSAEPSEPPTPAEPSPYNTNTNTQDPLDPSSASSSKDSLAASRTRSILNLTSSTLLGIYSPTALDNPREDLSSWDTGAQTPTYSYPRSPPINTPSTTTTKSANGAANPTSTRRYSTTTTRRHTLRSFYLPLLLRSALLFIFGVAYGTIITHLHDNPRVTPIKIENIDVIRRGSWVYMLFWGVAGVALGGLLPWFDVVWEELVGDGNGKEDRDGSGSGDVEVNRGRNGKLNGHGDLQSNGTTGTLAADWNQVVRSIGAFVGIAFAIRKLPWQSTLQVSLTLALVNPFLWYLIDRSKPGFMLSTAVGLLGMVTLLGINPDVVPAPNVESINSGNGEGMLFASQESIAVGTWIASVLFCSCVCFGNIGRRLAVGWGR
ncbi:hypothetical protein EMCG_09419 [[Emmonsia] crescens]|uniref:INSIG domain-containing protein n=1 Tax=[Emmonsia] crescens TaxID=73230 RepID=A0A0G2I241_9EURO|nr:hypothetical protein EMCG_09419 [Emmonsia crescens UAMH 3008]